MYIAINWVYGPEPRSSGGNTSCQIHRFRCLFCGLLLMGWRGCENVLLYKSDDPVHVIIADLCRSCEFEKFVQQTHGVSWKTVKSYKKIFGFRKRHSTHMTLMILLDKIINLWRMENLLLEFSEIFRMRFIVKWWYFACIRGTTLMWFKSYLSCRYVT